MLGSGYHANGLWVQRKRWWSTAPSGTRMTTALTATWWRVTAALGPTARSWSTRRKVSWQMGAQPVAPGSLDGHAHCLILISPCRLPSRLLLVAHPPAHLPPVAPGVASAAVLEILCLLQSKSPAQALLRWKIYRRSRVAMVERTHLPGSAASWLWGISGQSPRLLVMELGSCEQGREELTAWGCQ